MESTGGGTLELDRLKAFVDGVMAVLITILVLGLEVPEEPLSNSGLLVFLRKIKGQLHPYLASFALLAAFWIQQVVIVHFLSKGNRAFIWLNILFLVPLSLVPFATSLRAAHPETSSMIVFGILQLVCSLILLGIWRDAARRLARGAVDPMVERSMNRRILAGIALNLFGVIISIYSVRLGTLVFISVPLLYISHEYIDHNWAGVRETV